MPSPDPDAASRSVLFAEGSPGSQAGIQAAIERLDVPNVGPLGSGMLLIPAGKGPAWLRATARRVRARLVAATRSEAIWVGVGGTVEDAGGMRASQREAREAVSLGRRLFDQPGVVLFEDVLLPAAVACDAHLRDRIAGVLEPLATYDRRSRGVLLPSIEALLAADLSTTEAAVRLQVHRHTLVYRIERAEQILGRSVRREPDRALIEAALLARRLPPGPS